MPAASAASSISPDSRVSRTISTCGDPTGDIVAAARPSASASSAVRNSPATPRTPSVPNSFGGWLTERLPLHADIADDLSARTAPRAPRRGSALGELRPLSGLLETGLLALLHPRVAAEKAAALELDPQARVRLDQRTGNAVAERPCLRRHAAAVDAGDHVHPLLEAGGRKRLPGGVLKRRARKVVLQRAAVDAVGPVAGAQDHPRDRALALAGCLIARVGGQVENRARLGPLRRLPTRRLPLLLGRPSGHRLGLRLGLDGVGREPRGELVDATRRALLLEHEVGRPVLAGDDLLLAVLRLASAPAAFAALALARLRFRRVGDLLRLVLGGGEILVAARGLLGFALGRRVRGLLLLCPALGVGRLAGFRRRGALRLLGGGAFVLRRVGALVLGHRASTSIDCGFCAACGWSGPA